MCVFPFSVPSGDAMPRRVVLEGAGPGSRVLVVLEGAGPGFRVPAHMTRVPISLIATDADFSQRTVQVGLFI